MAGEIEEVLVEASASGYELTAVEEAFVRAGFDVDVRPDFEARGAFGAEWIVIVLLLTPIVKFLGSFGQTSGEEAAKDAYPAFKAWVKDTWAARRTPRTGEGSIRVMDPDGSNLILRSGYPDEALDAIPEIDWDRWRGSYLIWDETEQRWHDPTEPHR
jgi:hypothetical protein